MSDDIGNIFQFGEVLEQRLVQLEDKLEDQINKILDLSRMGAVFTSIFELDIVLPMVMETALSIVKGEVGEVVIFNQDGRRKSVSWGLNSAVTDLIKFDSGEKVYDYIKRTGESIYLTEVGLEYTDPESNATVNVMSFISAPLKDREKVIGAIAIANKEGREEFSSEDKFALEMLGSFAAVAVTNSNLHRQALQKQKIEHELDLAQQVQFTLMPGSQIFFDGLGVYTYNAQAGQVGGDFYDIIDLNNGRHLVLVADVSNKGIPAALIMSAVRSYIRVAAENIDSPAELAAKVNSLLCRDFDKLDNMFVTMFLGLVDTKCRRLSCANAGHPPGLLIRSDETIRLNSGGPILGQFADSKFSEFQTELKAGDRLFIFTDGVFECVNSTGEMLGINNVEEFLKNNCARPWVQLLNDLKALLKDYSFDPGRVDDTTLMMVEVNK